MMMMMMMMMMVCVFEVCALEVFVFKVCGLWYAFQRSEFSSSAFLWPAFPRSAFSRSVLSKPAFSRSAVCVFERPTLFWAQAYSYHYILPLVFFSIDYQNCCFQSQLFLCQYPQLRFPKHFIPKNNQDKTNLYRKILRTTSTARPPF